MRIKGIAYMGIICAAVSLASCNSSNNNINSEHTHSYTKIYYDREDDELFGFAECEICHDVLEEKANTVYVVDMPSTCTNVEIGHLEWEFKEKYFENQRIFSKTCNATSKRIVYKT